MYYGAGFVDLPTTFTAADLRLLLVDSLQKLDALFRPKTSEELKEWIKEYDGGMKNHGEPNTWDVMLVTDMSELFYDIIQYEFGMFYCVEPFISVVRIDGLRLY